MLMCCIGFKTDKFSGQRSYFGLSLFSVVSWRKKCLMNLLVLLRQTDIDLPNRASKWMWASHLHFHRVSAQTLSLFEAQGYHPLFTNIISVIGHQWPEQNGVISFQFERASCCGVTLSLFSCHTSMMPLSYPSWISFVLEALSSSFFCHA